MRVCKSGYRFCLAKTPLNDLHRKLKGKMVPYAGYEMPVQYPLGVLKEHLLVRESCGLFDVSHMGQIRQYSLIHGDDRVKFIELMTTGQFHDKKSGFSQLCLILNENGCIIDDTIAAKLDNYIHLVANASNKYTVLQHMEFLKKQYNMNVEFEHLVDKTLIAIQGPKAYKIMEDIFENDISKLKFMNMTYIKKDNEEYQINRCGYTGEDGFELACNNPEWLCEQLMKQADWCGLGARDSLRVESGLCLHGAEMTNTRTPGESRLMWTVRKKNKQTGEYNELISFYGRSQLFKRNKEATQMRIGFEVEKGIVRPPSIILDENGEQVGEVTSGTYSPYLKKGIGMGFINKEFNEGEFTVLVRDKPHKIKIVKTPFIQQNYYK